MPQPAHLGTGVVASKLRGLWLCLVIGPLAHVMEVRGVVVSSHIIPAY